MTASPPPAPPPHRPSEWGAFWRMFIAFFTGFMMPVMLCCGSIFFCVASVGYLGSFGDDSSFDFSSSGPLTGPAVAIIRVEGVIVSGRATSFNDTSTAYAATIINNIRKAAKDDDVKAIVLAVNSPGGGVVPSDEIYHALKQVDKPIVVVMGDLAASGGYYISMAAQWIVANPNTLTGSIGVISEFPQAAELMEKLGVDFVVITSGERKDVGSPFRDMTEAERAYWQTIIDEAYAGFVQIVADGRNMTVEEVKPFADGGVFTGQQAFKAGLVDQLGYEADAIAKAADLGGITGTPRVIEYSNSPVFFDVITQSLPTGVVPQARAVLNEVGHPRLSMRWMGP